MATTPTSSNILSGIQSVQGNRHAARLNAYNQNLAERQVYDTTSELLAGQIQQQEKQNKFISNALGIKNTPSSGNMWDSHHALLSEEYEAMFNDDVLKAVSQDEMLSAKWLADLNELNNRINEAEQFFSISFGDPSKADGMGTTFSDYEKAKQAAGGDYDNFFRAQGLSSGVDNSFFDDKVLELDRAAHSGVSYVPGEGFSVEWQGGNPPAWYNNLSPELASNVFKLPNGLQNIRTESPTEIANKERGYYDIFENSGEDGLKDVLDANANDYNTQLAAANYERIERLKRIADGDELKSKLESMTIQQYIDQELNQPGAMSAVVERFNNAIIEASKNRKKIAEEEKKKSNKTTVTTTTTTPPVDASGLQLISDDEGNKKIEFSGLDKMEYQGEKMSISSIERKKNGQYVVNLVDGSNDVIPVEFSTGDATDQALQKRIKDKYGDIIPQIISAMEPPVGTQQSGGAMAAFNNQ
jgi:hypothetical protein